MSSAIIVVDHFASILLLVVFLSLLPPPQYQLYSRGLDLVAASVIMFSLVAVRWLKPIVGVLKISMQSRTVSGVIILSSLAPRIGSRVVSRNFGLSRIRYLFDQTIGDDMLKFRRNVRRISAEQMEGSDNPQSTAESMLEIRDIRRTIQRRHTIGELLIGVVGSAVALIIGRISILAGLATLLSVYLLILPISMALRSVVVDTLAYPGTVIDEEYGKIDSPQAPSALRFKIAWNRMLEKNEAIIHKLIFVSCVRGEFVLGYELGEELIERVVTTDMELEEALDELVEEQIDDEVIDSGLVRRVIKRVIGI